MLLFDDVCKQVLNHPESTEMMILTIITNFKEFSDTYVWASYAYQPRDVQLTMTPWFQVVGHRAVPP